ncbi:hypothetical protein BSKO_07664 [Bryopsis sp. KO-2023]|nr:hypothetical protein BSKO_07664 [Bryopsis sp. KO-2023]
MATPILTGSAKSPLGVSVRGVRLSERKPSSARRCRQTPVVCARMGGAVGPEPAATLDNGAVVEGPDLSVTVDGLKLPNPFIIASGPPGTNYTVMKKALDEGWGGVICKTMTLDASKVINVTPRYATMKAFGATEVLGWENIELVSDRPFETMLEDLTRLRTEYPDRVLIASIMEEYKKEAWEEIIARCEDVGVDAFEINFSCPHGLPERNMGMAMGQNCDVLEEVCGWINAKATIPVWAKMTPNVTDITGPSRTALEAGCAGVSAINTITSVMGVNLDTLRPQPSVEGYTTPGGYSYKAVKPIALAKVMGIAKMIRDDFGGKKSLSGLGGVEIGNDAAEFILLGSDTVQVCSGVMVHGYPLIKKLCGGLQEFMRKHGFESIDDFKGESLQYFTTHADLVHRQKEATEAKRAEKVVSSDADWSGDKFTSEAESMVANK